MKKETKYKIIENSILKDIKDKKLQFGDQIPTEIELCKTFETSRMTVNRAITSLVSRGYIKRISGKGSFTEDMKSIGMVAGAKLLEYRILRASEIPEEITLKLKAENDDFIHYFSRLRTGNGIIFAVSYDYVPTKTLPIIDVSRLEGSFFEYVQEFGLSIGNASLTITATLPTEEQKKILKIKNEALLKVSHITELKDNRILEYIDTYYIGNMYSYKSYIEK